MDILILSGILLLIFLVDYKSSSILVLIYSSFGVIYFLLVKKKLYSIGKQQLQFDQIRIKNSQEAFLGIKTIKIFLKEKNFIDKYVYFYRKVANLSKSQSIIQQIPKHIIELLTIISFVTICILLMKNSINLFD